jgi:hypothetical protein
VHLHREILTAAEGAADAGQVEPDLLRPKPETGRDLFAVDVQPLRRDMDVDAALPVGDRNPGLRPEERLVLLADLVVAGDGDISGGVRIASLDADVLRSGSPREAAPSGSRARDQRWAEAARTRP